MVLSDEKISDAVGEGVIPEWGHELIIGRIKGIMGNSTNKDLLENTAANEVERFKEGIITIKEKETSERQFVVDSVKYEHPDGVELEIESITDEGHDFSCDYDEDDDNAIIEALSCKLLGIDDDDVADWKICLDRADYED